MAKWLLFKQAISINCESSRLHKDFAQSFLQLYFTHVRYTERRSILILLTFKRTLSSQLVFYMSVNTFSRNLYSMKQ